MRLLVIVAFLVSMAALSSLVQAYDVGISPDKLYAGEVARGASKVLSFSILTTGTDNLVVAVSARNASEDDLMTLGNNVGMNYSSEGSSGWLEFIENPVELRPDPAMAGSNVKAMKNINFLLNVPNNAEPGLHSVSIRPSPYTARGLGTGANMVGVIYLNLGFFVPGDASYSGIILDATAARRPFGIEINPYFQNTGTVTEVASLDRLLLFGSNGTLVASSSSGSEILRPGEVKKFRSMLGDVPNGDYLVSINFGLRGSVISKNITLKISGARPASVPGGITGGVLMQGPPFWLQFFVIIMIIGAAGYYTKKRFFD